MNRKGMNKRHGRLQGERQERKDLKHRRRYNQQRHILPPNPGSHGPHR